MRQRKAERRLARETRRLLLLQEMYRAQALLVERLTPLEPEPWPWPPSPQPESLAPPEPKPYNPTPGLTAHPPFPHQSEEEIDRLLGLPPQPTWDPDSEMSPLPSSNG